MEHVNLLRPYQRQGVAFLCERDTAILADEMGLGKTVQVAVALAALHASGDVFRVLIVVPTSLMFNWELELRRWAPTLSVRRLQDASAERRLLYLLPVNVLIVSYEQIRLDAQSVNSRVTFDLVVLDEAQRIKNADSATALACRTLRRRKSWALTGTPIENSVSDLVSICRFIKQGLVHLEMSRREIHAALRPFFLRRRKRDVLSELPEILIQDMPLQLTTAQRESYEEVWAGRSSVTSVNTENSAVHMFALLTHLKQICNYDPETQHSCKLEALKVIVEDLSTDDKILIFSQYVETLFWLSRQLKSKLPHDVFHGEQSRSQRNEVLQRFRGLPGPRGLLISLRAGGVGLNLQEATVVVLFDRWWNPALEAQAIHRAHRFGRERMLHVVRFLVSDSVEERIAKVLEGKQMLFDEYVDTAGNARVASLSYEDLRRILDMDIVEGSGGEPPPKHTSAGILSEDI